MKRIVSTVFAAIAILGVITGCAPVGKADYTKPAMQPQMENSVIINKSKDALWKDMVPALGREFFVINNLDKESGLINLSYTGDPEKYVDCGQITSTVQGVKGEQKYEFPGSKAYQEYQMVHQGMLLHAARRMNLEGRMNIVIQEIGKNQCQVTVNTRYVLSKNITLTNLAGQQRNSSDSISFNTGQKAAFPGVRTECQCNGEFEKTVLGILTGSPQ